MWKYVSRRIRETIEKSVNHFDKRSTTNGIVNVPPEEKNKRSGPPCRWYAKRKCWDSFKESNTNNERRNFYCPNGNWLNAITWSGAVVIGWYTSQLIHLKLKYHSKRNIKCMNNLLSYLHPYANCVTHNPAQLPSSSKIKDIINKIAPSVHLISNDKETEETSASSYSGSKSGADEFEDTLNYIENRLGWSAIQNGQPKDGIKLLRSAANRNHAPALYNLALCYEMGIGLMPNEKKAMELYRSAARLEHPAALYNLGIYYAQGRGGLKKDVEIATRLLRLAAVQGHQVAINTLKSLDEDVPEPERDSDIDTWSTYDFSPFSHQNNNVGPPSLTSLFVENVNYTQTPNYAQVVM